MSFASSCYIINNFNLNKLSRITNCCRKKGIGSIINCKYDIKHHVVGIKLIIDSVHYLRNVEMNLMLIHL